MTEFCKTLKETKTCSRNIKAHNVIQTRHWYSSDNEKTPCFKRIKRNKGV